MLQYNPMVPQFRHHLPSPHLNQFQKWRFISASCSSIISTLPKTTLRNPSSCRRRQSTGMQQLNRRSMDAIAAKVWFAVERSYELGGDLADARPWVSLFSSSLSCVSDGRVLILHSRLFLAAQRSAALRHDDDTQASLINRLLRSYLHYSLYDQADKLVSKTTFPASASNPQFARYH